MRFFISSLCVGFGGGLGGLARHASMQTLRVAGLPEYSALMVGNVCGCFLIGAAFIWLEGSLRRDGTSRLRHLPIANRFEDRSWWPDGDPTLPVVNQFFLTLNLQVLAAVGITGFLGTFTTFSTFSLLSAQFFANAAWTELFVNVLGSVALGYGAVWAGFYLGRIFVLREAARN